MIAEQYDVLCICCDKEAHNLISAAELQCKWENLLAGENAVYRILHIFAGDEHLGILAHPRCGNAEEYRLPHECIAVAQRYGVDVPLSTEKPMLLNTPAFWCRGAVLKSTLKCMRNEQQELLWYMLPFVAQKMGYYTGQIIAVDYAVAILCNQHKVVEQIRMQASDFRKSCKAAVRKIMTHWLWRLCKRFYYFF